MKIIHKNKDYLIIFIFVLIIGIVYWLSFYPGIMTYDSVYQWSQIAEFIFSDWHPAYHTILMWLISRSTNTPSSISFFQVVYFSFITAFMAKFFVERFQISKKFVFYLSILSAWYPLNGLMLVTIWKDVFYGLSFFTGVIILMAILEEDNKWLWVMLGITIGNIWLLRHNGSIVAISILLSCFLFFRSKKRKNVLISSLISFGLVFLVKGPIYDLFKVDRYYTQPTTLAFLHPIEAHVYAKTELTISEQRLLNNIYPLEGWVYDCHDSTVFLYKGLNFNSITDNQNLVIKTFLRLTISNPKVTLKHYLCVSSFVWQVSQPKDVHLETLYITETYAENFPKYQQYKNVVEAKPKLPHIREMIVSLVNFIQSLDRNNIIWRPALYTYLLLSSIFIYSLISGKTRYMIIFIPILAQTIGIGLTAQLQAVRFQYPVYLTAISLVPIFMYLFIREGIEKLRTWNLIHLRFK